MSKPMSKEQEDFQPSDELLEKVGQGLNNLDNDKIDDEQDSTLEDSQVSQAESEADSQLEIESEASEQDSTLEDSQVSQAESEADSKVSLPENYYRAAIHQGWTPEDIADFFDANSKKALKTFERIYNSTNKISKLFAAQGRQSVKSGTESSQKNVQSAPKSYIDVAKLREKYGDDEPAVEIADAINKGLQDAFGSKQEETNATPESNDGPTADDIAVAQVVTNFFGSDDMKLFKDFYGDGNSLNQMQDMNRYAVVQMADNIIAGADLHGQEIDSVEALTMAHLVITEPLREKILRKNILKSAKKRQKGMTFRPNKNKPAPTKPKTEKEKEEVLIKKTKSRMSKLFGSK